METVNVTVRTERQTRGDTAKLFSELGVSTTRAISMFLKLPVRKNDTGTIFQHERFLVMAGKRGLHYAITADKNEKQRPLTLA